MRIRSIKTSDLELIHQIHERDYPDLEEVDWNHLLSAFVIEDNNELIMAGGIEPIAEALLVTDKTKSRIKIGKALVEAQKFCKYICKEYAIRDLHAFTTNEEYAKHLIQHGFEKREELALRLKV